MVVMAALLQVVVGALLGADAGCGNQFADARRLAANEGVELLGRAG